MVSVQTALLNDHILPHDEPIRGHLAQPGENSIHVVIRINERDDDRQFASGFDKVRSVDFPASQKAGYSVEGDRSKDIFFAQVFQNFKMQRTMMPRIAFVR
jgi:hypothetical protein